MTFLTLTPTSQVRAVGGATPLNVTALLAAGGLGSNTGVEFVNSGREALWIEQGTAPTNFTVAIGETVEGESVTGITYTGVASAIQEIGPFDEVEDVQPGDLIQVTFATPANITGVALIGNVGAY
ncbi:MAG: hypothetical protein ACRDP7_30255 [Trebonia sp.]